MAERGANTIPIKDKKRLNVKNTRCALEAHNQINKMKKLSNATLKNYDKDMEEMKNNYAKLLVERPQTTNGLCNATLKNICMDEMKKNCATRVPTERLQSSNGSKTTKDNNSNTTKDNSSIEPHKILPPVDRRPGGSKTSTHRGKPRSRTISTISSSSPTTPPQKKIFIKHSIRNTNQKASPSTSHSSSHTKLIPYKTCKAKKKLTKSKTLHSILPKEINTCTQGTLQVKAERVSLNVTTCVYSTADNQSKVSEEAVKRDSASSMFHFQSGGNRAELLVHKRPLSEIGPDLVISDKQSKASYEHVFVYQDCEHDQKGNTVVINIEEAIKDVETPTAHHNTGESSKEINLGVPPSVRLDLIDGAKALAPISNDLYPTDGLKSSFPTIVNVVCSVNVLGSPDETQALESLNLAVKQMGSTCPYKDLLE